MNRPIDVLIVVKQIPLFKVMKHILDNASEVGRLTHMRSWAQLDRQLKAGKIDCFDLVLLDVTEQEQVAAIPKLRCNWSAAKLGLLVFDPELVAHRAAAFDLVLAKPNIIRNLLPWIRRVSTHVSQTKAPAQPIAAVNKYNAEELPQLALPPIINV